MNEIKEYKSKLFREGNSVVFRSEDFEQRWDTFQYIASANGACMLLAGNYNVQEYGDYVEENLGKNQSILGSFMNQDNHYNHEENLRIDYRKNLKRLRYKGFIQKYGISSNNFKRIFNAIMREIWDVKPHFSRYCLIGYKGRIKIDEYKVHLLHKHIDLILEAQNNNLNNMIPFIFYSGLNFKTLKDYMGENLWDSLIQNSHSRNNLIALKTKHFIDLNGENPKVNIKEKRTPPDFYQVKLGDPFKIDMRNVFDWIEYYNLFPSTILSHFSYIENSPATLALNECCKPKEFKKEYYYVSGSLLQIIISVISVCSLYGYDYSLKLTKEEWLKKYERLKKKDLKNTPF